MIGKRKALLVNCLYLRILYADGLPEGDDKIIWSINPIGIFLVKSLRERMLGSNHPIFPVKAIWKSKAPTKACFLVWQHPRVRFPKRLCLREEISV